MQNQLVNERFWVRFLQPPNFYPGEPGVLKFCQVSAHLRKNNGRKISLNYVALKGLGEHSPREKDFDRRIISCGNPVVAVFEKRL